MASQHPSVEGYWDDILKQSAKFKGRRVRVMVLEDKKQTTRKKKSLRPVDEATARFIKVFAGSWAGDDLDECLKLARQMRSNTAW